MKICPECGQENPLEDATYCQKCGASLDGVPSEAESSGAPPDDDSHVIEQQELTNSELETPELESESEGGLELVSEFDEMIGDADSKKASLGSRPLNGSSEASNLDEESKPADSAMQGSVQQQLNNSESDGSLTLGDDDKEKLLSDLQSKIRSMVSSDGQDAKGGNKPADHTSGSGLIISDYNKEIGAQPSEDFSRIQGTMSGGRLGDNDTDESSTDKVRISRGIAYFKGSDVHLTGGVKLRAGDELSYRDRIFLLKAKSRDFKSLSLYALLSLVVVLLVASQFIKRDSSDQLSPLFGTVVDAETNKVITDALVTIDELGKSVRSDDAGTYVFEMIPEGEYTITVESPEFTMAFLQVQHSPSSQSALPVFMEANLLANSNSSQAASGSTKKSEPQRKYGTLQVNTNNEKAEIFLDNKKYGTGNQKIKRVLEGKHKVLVKAEGFAVFEDIVTVKSDKTTTIAANLEKLRTKPVELSSAEYVQLGDSAFIAGDLSLAISSFTKAVAKDPQAETYYRRAQAYHKSGKPGDARKDFLKAGSRFAESGQASSAVGAYNAVLDLFPNDMVALRARGYAYIQRGQYELALADFKTACDINDDEYYNQLGMGDSYSVLGKHKDAIKAYKKAEKLTELADQKADVYALIAMASLSRGKEKDARKYYEKFLENASPEIESKYSADPEWQRLKQIASSD